jgi:hypothetical protein
MENYLGKLQISQLLSTAKELDKDRKRQICELLRKMLEKDIRKANNEKEQSEILHFLNKLHALVEKSEKNHSK